MINAIRSSKMHTFRSAYRQVDALLIDDVHLLSGKGTTQEEFFHTFNTLQLDQKQIVLSATCSPQDLKQIEPRLSSRFEWGIALSLRPLDTELMRQMVIQKATALGCPLNKKVVDFMLETFGSSPTSIARAIEAILLRIHLKLGPKTSTTQLSLQR